MGERLSKTESEDLCGNIWALMANEEIICPRRLSLPFYAQNNIRIRVFIKNEYGRHDRADIYIQDFIGIKYNAHLHQLGCVNVYFMMLRNFLGFYTLN